ncbi:replication initiation protein [Sphingomonas fennica]|uniref:Replication initiation protein n=1 Tax=Edaphosphingomonas fennica TaxID=114404 RepID=A0A2T4HSG2_9SPHN|nr:replication initiation protein [Sphingomonas fennica]PTD18754.1 replication initiation protein [Sphingomonas fennica]
MSGSIGAVLRSTGLVTINRAIEARANRPRAKIWSGSIAVGHEKRVNAYIPIRNARQMREMIEAAKLYERQTLAERRTATPRVRNGAIGQAGIQIIEFLARVIDYGTGALFPSLHTITEGTGLSKNCVVQALARLKAARILDWFRRYEPVPDAEAAGAGPRVKQATNAYRFLFPAFLAKIFTARRQRGRAADSTPACEQYRQIEAARELDRMMDQLPLWELPREQRDKRELAAVLQSLGQAIETRERESSSSEENPRRYL